MIKFNGGKRINTTQSWVATINIMMAVLENNDGYCWVDSLDKAFGLAPLAHGHRAKTQARRNADKLRKQSAEYILQRSMRRMRQGLNNGKTPQGWKKARLADYYKSDAYRAKDKAEAKARRPKKTAAAATPPVCTICKDKGHVARQCFMLRPTPHVCDSVALAELRLLMRAKQQTTGGAKQATTKRAKTPRAK